MTVYQTEVINGREEQIPIYPEITELDEEETAYVARWTKHSEAELLVNAEYRGGLFAALWLDIRRPHKIVCLECGRSEGFCNNRDCIRARVTNKLHLTDGLLLPEDLTTTRGEIQGR